MAGKFLYGLYFTAAAAILAFPCSATSAAFSVVAIIALFAHSSHAGSTATRTRTLITICSRASARTITNGTFAVTVACAASRTTGARIPSRHLPFLYYRDGPVIDLALSFFLFPHMFLADNSYLSDGWAEHVECLAQTGGLLCESYLRMKSQMLL